MGLLDFAAENYPPGLTSPAPLNNGSQTALLQNPAIGIYHVYAQYLGDPNTNAAQSASLPFTVTGDGSVSLNATNGTVTHFLVLDAQVQ